MTSPRRIVAVALALAFLCASVPAPARAVGEDPGLAQQWGLSQIGARDPWERGVLGGGSTVAVLDTGADLGHEDLRERIGAALTCVDTDGDPRRCVAGGGDIEGHGTHVAGIAAAAANRVGVSGVAPAAELVVVRVFKEVRNGDEVTYEAASLDIAAAIRWVIANVGARGAINLSLGGNFVVTSVVGSGFTSALEDAWRAGWVPVLASGNERFLGLGSSNYGSINAVVVGATGPDGAVAAYSSPFGNAKWALVAPGGNAASCEDTPERCVLSTYRDGQYAFLQGTSMATPHVAGAVALLMGSGLSNEQAVSRLLETADRRSPCGSGCDGRLDVAKATAGLGRAASPPPTAAPAPAPTGGAASRPAPTASPPPAATAVESADTVAPPTSAVAEASSEATVGATVDTSTPEISTSEGIDDLAAQPAARSGAGREAGGGVGWWAVLAAAGVAAAAFGTVRERRRATAAGGP